MSNEPQECTRRCFGESDRILSLDPGTYPVMVLKICVCVIYHGTSSRNSHSMRMVMEEGGVAELFPLTLSHCLVC